MAKYTVQLQPDYSRDGHKILISFTSRSALIDDIIGVLRPFELTDVISGDDYPEQNFDFYIMSEQGDFSLEFGDIRVAQDPNSISLRPQSTHSSIFRCKSLFANNSKFEILENLQHPVFEPINLWGLAMLGVSLVLLGLIARYGDPDFQADIQGLPLALLACVGAAVIVIKLGIINFVVKRMGEKFPDPTNLNYLTFGYMIALIFILLIFL